MKPTDSWTIRQDLLADNKALESSPSQREAMREQIAKDTAVYLTSNKITYVESNYERFREYQE